MFTEIQIRERNIQQLKAVDELASINSPSTYADGLTDHLIFGSRVFQPVKKLLLDYEWEEAVEQLRIIGAMAYMEDERQIALFSAEQVEITFHHFGDWLTSGAAKRASLELGRLDLYITLNK